MKRSGAYFGLHFDFHAVSATKGIGSKTKAEFIGQYLDKARPDYIQVDTKGHPGYASFNSKFGTVAPGLTVDHLKILREETLKRNIMLIAHYSGVFDNQACRKNPDWAIIDSSGKASDNITDVTGPYADKVLIPQLTELGKDYGLNGAWIDGECWAAAPNYRPEFLSGFYAESGFDRVDPDPKSESKIAFRYYCRRKFTEYMNHYSSEIKSACPSFEFTSNYAFSDQMPEKPLECIDFLSADSVSQADERFIVRCFAGKGKPWDVMSWGMSGCWNTPEGGFVPISGKSVSRLCREAAMAISQGGGWQVDNLMTSQGEIRSVDMEHVGELSEFMYARKPYNYRSVPLKNTAVLYSDFDRTRKTTSLYGTATASKPACDIVLDGGRPADVIYDYQVLERDFKGRSAIILPEITYMSEELRLALLGFVSDGGKLIICGVDTCGIFDGGGTASGRIMYVEHDGYMFGINGDVMTLGGDGSTPLCKCHADTMDFTSPIINAAVSREYGKGRLYFIGWNIMSDYGETRNFSECALFRGILDGADPEPAAYLESGSRFVELVPAVSDGRLIVNLINLSELYYDKAGSDFGDISPVYGIHAAVRCERAPKRVTLQPENQAVEFVYDGTYAHVTVSKLAIHSVLVFS